MRLAPAQRDPERILLIRPSALGDVCRSVPVLASLRARYPDARIDWLVRDIYAPAIAAHPALSSVTPFERDRLGGWWRGGAASRELLAFLRGLRDARYHLVIDCQGLLRSGLFAWATRCPRRVGWGNAAEGAPALYTRGDTVSPPKRMHTVDRMLALARAAGAEPVADMRLYTTPDDRASLPARLRGARYVLLAPTSRWLGKRWPAERFALLAQALIADCAADAVALIGGPGEREHCGPLTSLAERDPRIVDLIGRTDVGGMLAAVEASALVVANDSAAVHAAVGFARPMVALYGPTRVERVGPYGRNADVIQHVTPADRLDHKDARAGRALMERITTDEVLAAARERLTREHAAPAATNAAP